MYRRDLGVSFKLAGSPSLIPNNLSISRENGMCYVHQNDVCLVKKLGDSTKLAVSTLKSKIFQTSFAEIAGMICIVALSNLGMQVWSANGENMLFFFPMNSLPGFENEDECFFRGIAGMLDFLCVGTSSGNILIFNCADASKNHGDFSLIHNLESDQEPVSALSSSFSTLVGANDEGKLFVYKVADAFEKSYVFPGAGFPCTSLCQTEDLVIAGYTTGHIRLFRVDILELCVEISAHTRSITGLAVSPSGRELASCAQDQFFHVWTLPDFQSAASSHFGILHSEKLENNLLTGVGFLNDDRITITVYDEDELAIFRKAK